jgi:probable addiction module antidote protein
MDATREQFSTFDSADYLENLDDVAAYVEASLEDGDASGVPRALGSIARSGNISELARRVGMSREGLYKALSADGNPSFDTIVKVSRALGLRIHFESVA